MNMKRTTEPEPKPVFTNFIYNQYTGTIRSVPENYWLATVQPNSQLKFDSWDGAIVGRVDEEAIAEWWNEQLKTK